MAFVLRIRLCPVSRRLFPNPFPHEVALCRRSRRLAGAALLFPLLICPLRAFAIGQPQYITTTTTPGGFTLAQDGTTAKLYVDPDDDWGVIHAAQELQADIRRVTGLMPPMLEKGRLPGGNVVLLGTIGKSRLIDRLIRNHTIDVSSIRGRWEATLTQVVDHPLPGITRALVIAGSDRRGTIYGIYDLSENIGVSPWYWWADVPVPHRDTLYAKAGRQQQVEHSRIEEVVVSSVLLGYPPRERRGFVIQEDAPVLHDRWPDDRIEETSIV